MWKNSWADLKKMQEAGKVASLFNAETRRRRVNRMSRTTNQRAHRQPRSRVVDSGWIYSHPLCASAFSSLNPVATLLEVRSLLQSSSPVCAPCTRSA